MSAPSPSRRFNWLSSFVLVAAVLAIYGQTAGFPFVHWDDPAYVTRNAQVRAGLTVEGLRWALTDTQETNWHPLTWLSHMLDVELFGLEAGGHHATNVLFHALNSLLVFALLLRTTGARWKSAAVALLFAIHPLHVESVAWVSERKDVLSTFLALLATGAYVAYVEGLSKRPSRRFAHGIRYAVVFVLFGLALMAKSMVVTLPAVFLLLDRWPLRRNFSPGVWLEKLPLLLLALSTSILTLQMQELAGAMTRAAPLPIAARIANAIVSYGRYLSKTFWPSDLSMLYPHPYIPESGGEPLGALEIAAWTCVLVALSAWIVSRTDHPWAFVGWSWFLGTLVPVLGLVQVGHQGMADRYMYLPSIGLFILIVWTAGEMRILLPPGVATNRAIAFASALLMLALGTAAWQQTTHWRSTEALFDHALESVPRNPEIRFNVANRLRDEGQTALAIHHYRLALEAAPDALKPNINLANLLRADGRTREAISLYEHILEISPTYQLGHINLASAYRGEGRTEDAIEHYRRALDLGPSATAEFNLANLLRSEGRHEEAVAHYEASIALRADQPKAHNNLGISLLATGQSEIAARHFSWALALQPKHHRAANNLGIALERQNQIDAAIEAYERALSILPDYASAHRNLASLLAREGRPDAARRHFERLLALDPDDADAQRGLEALSRSDRGSSGDTGSP